MTRNMNVENLHKKLPKQNVSLKIVCVLVHSVNFLQNNVVLKIAPL